MTLRDRYNAIYARLWGYRDDCDAQHHAVLSELEKELDEVLDALCNLLIAEEDYGDHSNVAVNREFERAMLVVRKFRPHGRTE